MAGPYTYQALQSNENIRLFRLLPSSNDSKIECEIVSEALPGARPYTTLSYDTAACEKRELLVNGCSNNISAVLHSLLSQLRTNGQLEWFWADAVCVDQSNDDERAQQTLLLRQIYSGASSTIIWLGDDFDGASAVIKLLNDHVQEHGAGTVEAPTERRAMLLLVVAVNMNQAARAGFRNLVALPYWSQLAIIGQIALAKQHTIMAGSSQSVPGVLLLLQELMLLDHKHLTDELSLTNMELVLDLWKLRSGIKSSDGGAPLLNVIGLERKPVYRETWSLWALIRAFALSLRSPIPHDRIYSLLCLASDADKYHVDYRLSIPDLCLSMLVRMESSEDLATLRQLSKCLRQAPDESKQDISAEEWARDLHSAWSDVKWNSSRNQYRRLMMQRRQVMDIEVTKRRQLSFQSGFMTFSFPSKPDWLTTDVWHCVSRDTHLSFFFTGPLESPKLVAVAQQMLEAYPQEGESEKILARYQKYSSIFDKAADAPLIKTKMGADSVEAHVDLVVAILAAEPYLLRAWRGDEGKNELGQVWPANQSSSQPVSTPSRLMGSFGRLLKKKT